jgi:Fe-S cluster biogenesis protein NfuA/nitrite reductase/ring-hydroxylating ferredoxin subunit
MEPVSVREVSERIEALLDDLGQSTPPPVLARVEELVHAVMSLYGAGLSRLVEVAPADVLRRLADDEVVGNLLVLHDLHPDDVDTRVRRALDSVRPYLGSHAGDVTLTGVDTDGVVHLRLEGSCDGCPSSALTVKSAIEDAILVAAPDVVAVEAEGMVDAGPALLQIAPFTPHDPVPATGADGHWEHLDLDVPPRTLRRVDVAGEAVLVANLDGTLVAYLDRCPGCLVPLSGGTLAGETLRCPAGHAYDVRRAGRALDADSSPLTPVPLLPEHGAWKMALPRRESV